MEKKEILYGAVGFLGGILLTVLLTGNVVNSNNTGMMNMMGVSTSNQKFMGNSNSIDAHFIEQMIPHHEDAITMAKLAQTKAQKPEVRQLAENIINSQGKEINQMKAWYKDWFGKEVTNNNQAMTQHGMMNDDSDTTNLKDATDFDRLFIEEMIPHHQMAVMMANMLLSGTNRPEMKKLATDIIAAQTKEINQMRQWYKDWGFNE